MNATNTTEGGYVGSVMYKTGLDNAKAKFKAAFGDMLLTHRPYLVTAVANGKPFGGAWIDETVALMCYIQISLLGVAGYIKVGNSIADPMTTDDDKSKYWYTPMYFSDIWVIRRF